MNGVATVPTTQDSRLQALLERGHAQARAREAMPVLAEPEEVVGVTA